MKCNFKWLSLYVDGELSQRKRDKLEKHLQLCETCAEKLEELKELESLAARAKLPQISEAYWENFAVRVRNKLLLREKESPSVIFWTKIRTAFQISPFRLKLAAAVASVLIVAWVGKIYMDYRPAPVERQLLSPSLNLPEKPLPQAETTKTFLPSTKAEQDMAKTEKVMESKSKESVSSEQFSPAVPLESQAPLAQGTYRSEPAPVELPPEIVKGEKPVIDKDVTSNLHRITAENIEVPPVKKGVELHAVPQEFATAPAQVNPDTSKKLPGLIGFDIAYRDTPSTVSALRKIIQQQEKFIVSQLADTILEKTYQDLAQYYLNLCLLTKSKEDVKAGHKRIQEMLQQYLYPSTRISLNKILEKLRALERSLE